MRRSIPGHTLALQVTPANEQERAQVADLGEEVQAGTGATVEIAYADQGYSGEAPAQDAATHAVFNGSPPSPSTFCP